MVKTELFLEIEKEFQRHLLIPDNERIMFSGVFGIGKTTFLNHFFKKEENKALYNTIHLSPINYSVLANEDIFKYIKYDIIYELMESGLLNSNIHNFDAVKDISDFSRKNILHLGSLLLLFIPKMGRQLFQLKKELEKTIDNFSEHLKNQNEKAIQISELLNSYSKTEGDLYEFNLLTQVISDTLKNIKKTKGDEQNLKKNILIIDDIDRIDPRVFCTRKLTPYGTRKLTPPAVG